MKGPSLVQRVGRYIASQGLIPSGGRVLVGTSGGLDSVVLLHVLYGLGYPVAVAHLNYRVRGEAADEDAAFVEAMRDRLGVPGWTRVVRDEERAAAAGQGFQAWARDLRYAWFEERATASGIPVVAVAHHADDQAETVLLNLLRGAGLGGLAGMRPSRPLCPASKVRLVRPLLDVWRHEIRAHADAEGLAWREDASNAAPQYRRNAIRHTLMPRIRDHFGEGGPRAIVRTATLMASYHQVVALPSLPDGLSELQLDQLQRLPAVLQQALILDALAAWLPEAPRGQAVAEAVAGLLHAQPGRRVSFKTGTVWRERDALVFEAQTIVAADGPQPLLPGSTVILPQGHLHFSIEATAPPSGQGTANGAATPDGGGATTVVYLDADVLTGGLQVRRWRAGDRFRPFGMQGHKKVSDLLTERKVRTAARQHVHVVEADGQILWVVGHRQAEVGRLTAQTRRFAKFVFIPHENDE